MRWIARLLLLIVLLAVLAVALLLLLPARWLADTLESVAADRFALDLDIGHLALKPWSSSPAVRLQGLSLGVLPATADGKGIAADVAKGRAQDAVAPLIETLDMGLAIDLLALLGGKVVFDRIALEGGTVELVVNERGRANWQQALDGLSAGDGATATEPSDSTGGIPAIRELDIDALRLVYNDRRIGREASIELSADGSTLDSTRPTRVDLAGSVAHVPVSLKGTLSPLQLIDSTPEQLSVDLAAELGESAISVAGVIGEPASLSDLDVAFSIAAPDLEDFADIVDLSLPKVPPFSLDGNLKRDGDEWLLRRFDGTLGESDLGGDIRVDPTTEPLTIYANLISRRLDPDTLVKLFGGSPETNASADGEPADNGSPAERRLLSDSPLPVASLLETFNGAIRVQVREVQSAVWPIDSIETRFEISGSDLTLSPVRLAVAGGEIAGSVDLDVSSDRPTGTIDLRIRQVDLQRVLQSIGFDDDSFGVIGGRAKYWIAGESIAQLAGSADGGLFLLMTGGKLDALLAEIAGLDIVEATALLIDPGKTLTPIDCAYLDLHTADGLARINRLVFDTRDTLFQVDGTVDLDEERFDITIEPHPKDVSLLGGATAVRLAGSPGSLDVTPGLELPLRAAAAAILGSLAAPVAALLPMLQSGLTEDSPYCDGLVDALDEAR